MLASLCCVSFSLVLFVVVCVLMERCHTLGKNHYFLESKLLTLMLEELSSRCSYLDKVSSKSGKNVNYVMIAVFTARWV